MKMMERVVMVILLFGLVGGGVWIYFATHYEVKKEQTAIREAVARGDFEIRNDDSTSVSTEDWQSIYPNTVSMNIASTTVLASVADDLAERIKGLSDTPFLPENVVKLFVFGAYGEHSIWMKDMNYSIDILWATKEGEIVHIEENVSPETFPASFASPTPAWYVVETNAGFVESNGIGLGDRLSLPNQI